MLFNHCRTSEKLADILSETLQTRGWHCHNSMGMSGDFENAIQEARNSYGLFS